MKLHILVTALAVDFVVAALALGAPITSARADDATEGWTPTPQEQAFAERVHAINDERARDGTLRERIAFSQSLDADDGGRPVLHERTRLETLVDAARGQTDPVILQLLLHRCSMESAKDRCDAVALARRWTEADIQNQVAWLGLAAALSAAGDAAAARGAFIRAASASTWQSGYTPVLRALVNDVPRALPPPDRLALLGRRGAAASLVVLDAQQALSRLCKGPEPDMRAACTRIIETMARDGDTAMDMTMASMIARRGTFDTQRLRDFQRKSDALHWAESHVAGDTPTWFETEDTPRVRDELARLDAMLVDGERRYLERRLAALAVSESDAAARYAATMSAESRKIRAARVTPQ